MDEFAPSKLIRALHTVAQSLKTLSGQRRLLCEVLGNIERELGLRRCTVMILSPNGEELTFCAAGNALPSVGDEGLSYRKGEGITGHVLETGEAAIVPRISEEPNFKGRIFKRPIEENAAAGFICLPVLTDAEVVGTLAADVPYSSAISMEDAGYFLGIISCMISHDVQLRRESQLRCESLEQENIRLRGESPVIDRPLEIKGNSRTMREVFRHIHQVAPADTTVLIRGESGTGKELVACAIHRVSHRKEGPFVKVNCAALSETLLESELFGHERGAFTGALQTRVGRIEEAQGGTLFLDEIGEISPLLQVKLLRVLQEKEFQRVGSNRTIRADIRVLTATNRNLEKAIAENQFRKDLYFRINVFAIQVPPLRERKEDLMTLADHFVMKFAQKIGKDIRRISTAAINMMYAYHWPGNVRELENCIEHAVLVSADHVIHAYDLPPSLQMPEANNSEDLCTLTQCVCTLERDLIIDALKRSNGNVSAASRMLGITGRIIRYKIEKLGIDCKGLFGCILRE